MAAAEGRWAAWSPGTRTDRLESGCSPEASLVRRAPDHAEATCPVNLPKPKIVMF